MSAAAAFSLSRSSRFAPVPLFDSILSSCEIFAKKLLLMVLSILVHKVMYTVLMTDSLTGPHKWLIQDLKAENTAVSCNTYSCV